MYELMVIAGSKLKTVSQNKGGRPKVYSEQVWLYLEWLTERVGSIREAYRVCTQTSKTNNGMFDSSIFAAYDRVPCYDHIQKTLKKRKITKAAKAA